MEKKDAPPSGLSTRTVFRYEILNPEHTHPGEFSAPPPIRGLLSAYGAAAHLYREVGGGDAFLKAEREGFDSTAAALAPSEGHWRKNGSKEQ
jgi:hypothetical protein